ncbi:MAG: dihydrodipicolinate synthase family protein [Aquisalimonadaceae bacterium]
MSERSIARLIDTTHASVAGYIPCLTSGEGWKLSATQWLDMVRYTLRYADGREVIAGIEKPTTREVLKFAYHAEDLGVQTIIVSTPFGETVSQADMLEHFRRIHDETALSIFIYNESELSSNECSLETLLRIADLPKVTGIKDSCHERRPDDVISEFQRRGVSYFQGFEDRLMDESAADGNIVSLSNLEPGICCADTLSNDARLKKKMIELCDTYALSSDDWYRHVKVELRRREIINSARLASG